MSELNLVCLHFQECHLLPQFTSPLSEILGSHIFLGKVNPELEKFLDEERRQYNAADIISNFEKNSRKRGKTILITSVDLYIPIFTFIFGLAKLNGTTGIVSSCRLKKEFYGLPPDDELFIKRLVKEVIHEFGHLLNLRHCSNYKCVMASSNTADELDIKNQDFCLTCRK
jgi:archaemetzincin